MLLPRYPCRQAASRENGVALILVLWMLVLLTAIAQNLSFSSRVDLLATGNLASQARAEAIADAAVHRAIHQLSQPAPLPGAVVDTARWKADGLARLWHFQEADLQVTIIGESGKIDINAAPPPLLEGLFVSVGIDQATAQILVDAMLDWRDSDELRRLQGAEKPEYLAAGLRQGPANRDFIAIDELQQVLGFSAALFQRIETLITVHSRQPGIDPATAPRDVLLALPNASPELVDQYVQQRQALLEQGLPPLPFPLAQGLSASTNSSVSSILAEVILSDNTRFIRQAVVRLNGSPTDPVSILAWRAPSYFNAVPAEP